MLFGATHSFAAFEFMWMVNYECDVPGLEGYQIWRVYAQFTDPGDRLTAVVGTPSSPATITLSGGAFYQHPLGGNTAPDAEMIAKDPLVARDTFCTIGLAQDIDGADGTLTFGFGQLPVVNDTSLIWFVPIQSIEQGAPDADGLVLILQLTMPETRFLMCDVGLQYQPAGTTGTLSVNGVSPVLLPLSAGDINHDLDVDIDDLLMVINSWGDTGPEIPDPTDDGMVNIEDLLVVLMHWGAFTGLCP
jgi:hypothetical protein